MKLIQQDGDGLFLGRLLNEPWQNFGIHEGDMVDVRVSERKEGVVAACLGKATKNAPA